MVERLCTRKDAGHHVQVARWRCKTDEKSIKVSLILKFAALISTVSQHLDGHFRTDNGRFNAQDLVTIIKSEIPVARANQ